MDSGAFERMLQPLKVTQLAIWGAFTASVAFFQVVAFQITRGDVQPLVADATVVTAAAYAVALALALAAELFRARSGDAERLRQQLATVEDPAVLMQQRNPGASPTLVEKLDALPETDRRLLSLAMKLQVPFVIGMALNEGVALVGLVLAIFTAEPMRMLPFTGVALALCLRSFPRLPQLLARARGHEVIG